MTFPCTGASPLGKFENGGNVCSLYSEYKPAASRIVPRIRAGPRAKLTPRSMRVSVGTVRVSVVVVAMDLCLPAMWGGIRDGYPEVAIETHSTPNLRPDGRPAASPRGRGSGRALPTADDPRRIRADDAGMDLARDADPRARRGRRQARRGPAGARPEQRGRGGAVRAQRTPCTGAADRADGGDAPQRSSAHLRIRPSLGMARTLVAGDVARPRAAA